jgi:hypothetical protein
MYDYKNILPEEALKSLYNPGFLSDNFFIYNSKLTTEFILKHFYNPEKGRLNVDSFPELIYICYNPYLPSEFFEEYVTLNMLHDLYGAEISYDYDRIYGPYEELNPRFYISLRLELVKKYDEQFKFDYSSLRFNKYMTGRKE